MMREENTTPFAERGAAMMIVMVFLTLALMSLGYGFERTRQLFAFEESSHRIAATDDGVEKALGIGIARLRSGVPDDDSFGCQLKLRDADGSSVERYHVFYTKVATDRWNVEAYPSGSDIVDCPDVFTTSCPVGP
jgi:hypothetical protein